MHVNNAFLFSGPFDIARLFLRAPPSALLFIASRKLYNKVFSFGMRSLWQIITRLEEPNHPSFNRTVRTIGAGTALVLVGLLMLAGCDAAVDLHENDTESTTRAVPADSSGLALAPMPTGATLLAPGEPAPKSNSDASAYGCYLASRPYSEQVAFHSKYLHFPEAIVEAANGQTRDVAYRVRLAVEPLPERDISEAEIPQTSGGVRLARCTIPDVEEAEELAWEQVIQYGEAEAIAQAVEAEQAETEQGEAKQGEAKQGQAATSQAPTSKSSETTCVIREAWICIIPGDCRLDTRWVECNSYGPGGGGSPPAGQYPDPNEPSPDDPGGGGGSTGEGGSAGGAECSTQQLPEAGSDCDPPAPSEPPPGVSDDLYDSLNEEEKSLCWESPVQCYQVGQYASWALDWAQGIEPDGAHNGPQDAIRHAAWSARITMNYGSETGRKWTDAHEWDSSFPEETNMDQYNNAMGREIGVLSSDLNDLQTYVESYYEDGILCTSLSDC